MKTSSETTNIYKHLFEIENELTPIVKDKYNEFTKSKYADLNSVLNIIKEPFKKHDILLKQYPDGSGGLITQFIHMNTGEFIESNFTIELGEKFSPQMAGAAITYQRRYAIVCMLNLQLCNDTDGNNKNKTKQQEVLESEFKRSQEELIEHSKSEAFFWKLYQIDKTMDKDWNPIEFLKEKYTAKDTVFNTVLIDYKNYRMKHNLP